MKASMGFGLLAGVAGLLIVLTRTGTHDAILANQAAAEATMIADLLGETVDPDAANRLCRTSVRGYAGLIKLLILPRAGTTPPRTIQAVRVLSHSETPGIGDFISLKHSPWILQFNARAARLEIPATIEAWDTELDGVTGATITRRAVIEGIANACPRATPRGSDPLFSPLENAQ